MARGARIRGPTGPASLPALRVSRPEVILIHAPNSTPPAPNARPLPMPWRELARWDFGPAPAPPPPPPAPPSNRIARLESALRHKQAQREEAYKDALLSSKNWKRYQRLLRAERGLEAKLARARGA